MRHPQSIAFAGILMMLSAACGNHGGRGSEAESSAYAPLAQRLNQEQGFVQDSQGNWIPRNNRRSQLEGRAASGIERSNHNANRRFNANNIQTAEWTRASSARPQSYSGPTDGSGIQKPAAAQGQEARQSGAQASIPGEYDTEDYRTGASRENRGRRFARKTDAQTENRRDSLPPPEIIDWREQRRMSIEQSRSMLSR
jgi:hypothetical protein